MSLDPLPRVDSTTQSNLFPCRICGTPLDDRTNCDRHGRTVPCPTCGRTITVIEGEIINGKDTSDVTCRNPACERYNRSMTMTTYQRLYNTST